MSWEVTSLVRSRKVGNPTSKSILMIFADVANHDGGGIWLSKASIAAETEVGINTVRSHIKKMTERGILKEVGKRKCSNGFTVVYDMDLAVINALELTRPKFAPLPLLVGDTTSLESSDTPSQMDINNPEGGENDPPLNNLEEIFEKLWKEVSAITPKEIKGRHTKKTSLAQFKKLVTRKKNPVSASRIANAVLWLYDSPPQKMKDNDGVERGYMKALERVLRDEKFEPFLADGVFNKRGVQDEKDEAWRMRIEFINNSGEWPSSAPSPRTMPKHLRVLLSPEAYNQLFGE